MFFNINDLSVYYEKYGSGKENILILPGWGDTRRTFFNIIKVLKECYTVYILDYPGFGYSPFPNRDLDIYQYAELIISFVEKNNIQNPIIISHSFGGRISILMAGLYKTNIKKMILINSAGIKPKKKLKTRIKQLIYKCLKKVGNILPNKIKTIYLEKLISIFGSNDFKNLNVNIRKTFIKVVNEDLSNYLEHIKVSTLLIWGANDQDTPVNDGRIMNSKIEDSGLVIIPNAGHFTYLEFPYYTNKIILEFLNQL